MILWAWSVWKHTYSILSVGQQRIYFTARRHSWGKAKLCVKSNCTAKDSRQWPRVSARLRRNEISDAEARICVLIWAEYLKQGRVIYTLVSIVSNEMRQSRRGQWGHAFASPAWAWEKKVGRALWDAKIALILVKPGSAHAAPAYDHLLLTAALTKVKLRANAITIKTCVWLSVQQRRAAPTDCRNCHLRFSHDNPHKWLEPRPACLTDCCSW